VARRPPVKLTPAVRRVAAVLAVVFALTTIWAGYTVYQDARSAAPSSPTATATYTSGAFNTFVADLQPSALYNNLTHIVGGNITLFPAITNWINATIQYSVQTNRTTAISLQENFAVILSTSVWSKTLFESTNASSSPSTALLSLTTRYDLNVTYLVELVEAIEKQTGYVATSYTVSLLPQISGLVSAGNIHGPIAAEPRLNFTFAGGLITPSGLQYSSTGALDGPTPPSAPLSVATVLAYVGLGVSVIALAVCAWILTRPREEVTPPLETIIAPYSELIAETAAAPQAEVAIPVGRFADLVKIADTLGKPILRPTEGTEDRKEFVVVDGWIAYSFKYPGFKAAETASPAPPGGPVLTPISSRSTDRVVRRIQSEADRLRGLQLDDATSKEVRRRIRRAIDLVHAKELSEADFEVDELSWLLDRAEMRSSRTSGR
jgi:hypothetical protein